MKQSTTSVAGTAQVRPRKRETAGWWRRVLEDQRASGFPISAFCRQRGIAQSSLFAWRRRLGGGQDLFKPVKLLAESEPEPSAAAAGADRAAGIELCLTRGHRLIVRQGFDRQLLLELLDALEARP